MFSGVVMLLGGLSNGYSGAITGGAVSRLKPELRMTALQEALFQSAPARVTGDIPGGRAQGAGVAVGDRAGGARGGRASRRARYSH